MTPKKESWHIQKGIPVALIVAVITGLFGNMIMGVWYASKLDSRVGSLEEAVLELKPLKNDVIAMKTQNGFIQGDIAAIRDSVDQLTKTFITDNRNYRIQLKPGEIQ